MIFTTSWDDGYTLDNRISALLEKYGATGTFYVCPNPQHGKAMLTKDEIYKLSQRHEIGGHTMTHPHLTQISLEEAKKEIIDGKNWIEDITNKKCTSFCYPYGDNNIDIQNIVKDAGFTLARTVEQLHFDYSGDPFSVPTSLLVYPFPIRPIANRRLLKPFLEKRKKLKELGIPLINHRSWLSLSKALFTKAYKGNMPWFHLWGHSAEIEKHNQWNDLEKFLAFVKSHDNIQYLNNSEIISIISNHNK